MFILLLTSNLIHSLNFKPHNNTEFSFWQLLQDIIWIIFIFRVKLSEHQLTDRLWITEILFTNVKCENIFFIIKIFFQWKLSVLEITGIAIQHPISMQNNITLFVITYYNLNMESGNSSAWTLYCTATVEILPMDRSSLATRTEPSELKKYEDTSLHVFTLTLTTYSRWCCGPPCSRSSRDPRRTFSRKTFQIKKYLE